MHEAAVGRAVLAGSGVDLRLPQRAVVAFFLLSAAIGMAPGMEQGFLRGALLAFSSPAESLGVLEEPFPFFVGGNATLYARHREFSFLMIRPAARVANFRLRCFSPLDFFARKSSPPMWRRMIFPVLVMRILFVTALFMKVLRVERVRARYRSIGRSA